MRWIAMLPSIALFAGCLGEATVDCGNGFFCPAGLACAAPGYCGEPAQVATCSAAEDWDPCAFDNDDPTSGSCRHGICGACNADREGCTSGWTAMSVPASPQFNSIWVVDRAHAYAVGNEGTLLHYNGVAWRAVITEPPIPPALTLLSVWASSASDIYIVSDNATDQNLLHIVDGTLSFVSTGSMGLKAVWGTAPDNVYVAGFLGAIRRFDGATWQLVQSGGQTYASIHGANASRIYAMSATGAFATYDGMAWTTGTIPGLPTGAILEQVWVGDSDVIAVGDNRLIVRWNGTDWKTASMFDGVLAVNLSGVWGSGPSDYYVVGDSGTIGRSTDGETWTGVTQPPGVEHLYEIAGMSPTNIFAVGSTGAIWKYSGD